MSRVNRRMPVYASPMRFCTWSSVMLLVKTVGFRSP